MVMLSYKVIWINKLPFRDTLAGTPDYRNKTKTYFLCEFEILPTFFCLSVPVNRLDIISPSPPANVLLYEYQQILILLALQLLGQLLVVDIFSDNFFKSGEN